MISLEDLTNVYYKARLNKRRYLDSCCFEIDFESELLKLLNDINNRTFVAENNYAFVVFRPKPREIFATEMRNRIIHHYLDWRMRDIYEKVLSDRSFNNRKGKGLHKAIETFKNDIYELTENFTKDAWICHLDLKGYFPNANVEIALSQQLELIEKYYNGSDKDDLKYMMNICMRSDPARHCKIKVSMDNWKVIKKDKSLFNKPVGIGGAIGFLCWQNAMGLYINDVVKWIQSNSFVRIVVFVDDIYMISRKKEKLLGIIPEIRKRLSEIGVSLNEKKFYFQHYSKGVMVLGTMLKYKRSYCNNKTLSNALNSISKINRQKLSKNPISTLCSINSYSGIMKIRNERGKLFIFMIKIMCKIYGMVMWDNKRRCFNLMEKYNVKNTYKRRYMRRKWI